MTVPESVCQGVKKPADALLDGAAGPPAVILFDAEINEWVEALQRLHAWARRATLITLSVEEEPPAAIQTLNRLVWIAKPQLHRQLSAALRSAITPGENNALPEWP